MSIYRIKIIKDPFDITDYTDNIYILFIGVCGCILSLLFLAVYTVNVMNNSKLGFLMWVGIVFISVLIGFLFFMISSYLDYLIKREGYIVINDYQAMEFIDNRIKTLNKGGKKWR